MLLNTSDYPVCNEDCGRYLRKEESFFDCYNVIEYWPSDKIQDSPNSKAIILYTLIVQLSFEILTYTYNDIFIKYDNANPVFCPQSVIDELYWTIRYKVDSLCYSELRNVLTDPCLIRS